MVTLCAKQSKILAEHSKLLRDVLILRQQNKPGHELWTCLDKRKFNSMIKHIGCRKVSVRTHKAGLNTWVLSEHCTTDCTVYVVLETLQNSCKGARVLLLQKVVNQKSELL